MPFSSFSKSAVLFWFGWVFPHILCFFCLFFLMVVLRAHCAVKLILLKWMRGLWLHRYSATGVVFVCTCISWLHVAAAASSDPSDTLGGISALLPGFAFIPSLWGCLSLICFFTAHLIHPWPGHIISFPICSNVCKRESLWVKGMAGLFLVGCSSVEMWALVFKEITLDWFQDKIWGFNL